MAKNDTAGIRIIPFKEDMDEALNSIAQGEFLTEAEADRIISQAADSE